MTRRNALGITLKDTLAAAALVFAALAMQPAGADPRPAGGKPVDPNAIAQAYVGKTQLWKSCQGGIHYGSGGAAEAWCAKHPESVGIGKWTVDRKGRVCQSLTWYWPDGKTADGKTKVGSKPGDPECIKHLVTPDGTVWRNWPKDAEWWKLTGTKNLVKGSKFRNKIRRSRRKVGL